MDSRGACLALLALLCLGSLARAMPNIRIQVNSENLQSAPYLLDAIKQAESGERQAAAAEAALLAASQNANKQQKHQQVAASEPQESSLSSALNVIKEETIEEMLDLEPDSVLKLSPENMANLVSSAQEYSKLGEVGESGSLGESMARQREAPGGPAASQAIEPVARKPDANRLAAALPVTGSHLKRPLQVALDEAEGVLGGAARPVGETRAQMDDESAAAARQSSWQAQAAASSRVSPSVADADEPPQQAAVNLDRKPGQQPPDTLELGQVMAGVANASLVPATVTRNYGTNSRTRITLGGGYVRDRKPALVDPSAESKQQQRDESEAQAAQPAAPAGEPNKIGEQNTRLVEVPERIVLPAGIFDTKNQEHAIMTGEKFLLINTTSSSNNNTPLGKPDSRCPKRGSTTLEHPTACDRYFYCQDGRLSEHECPNGLMYGTRELVKDFCVHRWQAICGDKSVPNPISSPGCRWQWGLFSVQGSPKCTPDFYECRDGAFEVKKCSLSGQVYDDRTKSCRFAEQVGCAEEALADFTCPPDDQGNTYWPFPRYFLNERALIHCVNDKPAIVRCRDNERVDPEHLHCVIMKQKSNGDEEQEQSSGLAQRSSRERSSKAKKPASVQAS